MRAITALALAVTLPATAQAQQRIALRLSPEGIASTTASVGGTEGTFMFDSGLGISMVTPAFAGRIGCKPWGRIVGFRGSGERLDLPHCNTTRVRIGSYAREVSVVTVLDLPKLMGAMGTGLDGAIGLDAFDGRTVTLSVARNDVTIETPRSLAAIRRTAREVPIRIVRNSEGASLTASMGVPTAKGLLWMEVDTGGYAPVRVDRNAALLLGLDPAKGVQHLNVTVAPGVRLDGEAIIQDLVEDGIIGRTMLQGWDATIDLAAGRGWMRPARH